LNNNKLINERLICAFLWSVLPSIMKMHGPKNKKQKKKWNIVYRITCNREFISWSRSLRF